MTPYVLLKDLNHHLTLLQAVKKKELSKPAGRVDQSVSTAQFIS
jgi:hypothetical protein